MKNIKGCAFWLKMMCFVIAGALLVLAFVSRISQASGSVALLDTRNLPADHKILFFMGQDSETLTQYRKDVLELDSRMPKPGGITLYTKIAGNAKEGSLQGLIDNVDYGAGIINFERSLLEFPVAALAVGLSLTDAEKGCQQIPTRAIAGMVGDGVSQQMIHDYREQIGKLLMFLKATKRPVFLRIGYEFDGPWNCYQPESYKAAFRFIKQRIVQLATDNIATVWQSAAWPRNQGIYRVIDPMLLDKFYPGDDVVDWVSLSTFYGNNYRDHQWVCDDLNPEWFTPAEPPRLQQNRILNFARNHQKPVMIAEASPVAFSNSQLTSSCIFSKRTKPVSADIIWTSWYADWFKYIENNKDIIRAVAYINTHWHTQTMWYCAPQATAGSQDCLQGYWGDSRVQANPEILKRFKSEISKPIYVNGADFEI